MTTQTKYFNVPIPLLRGLMTGEKEIKHFVQKVVTYSLYQQSHYLPYSDESETGFANEIETQIKASASFLNVSIGNIDHIISEGGRLFDEYHKQTPYSGVRTRILWDYNRNPKTERQIAQFCAFCATRSILGKGRYKKTNRKLIVARMFGYNTIAEYEQDAPVTTAVNINKAEKEHRIKIAELRNKYLTRYHNDKILEDLELSWGLKRYSNYIRGMYISYTESLESLAKICEANKRKTRQNALKERKRKAREAAKKTTP